MGCWNHTCFLSNLSIGHGTDMALMTLIETAPDMGVCRPTEHFYPAPVMIYGKYDDYGGMENCYGSEIDYLLKEFVDNHTLEDTVDIDEFTRIGDSGGLYFSDINLFHQKLKGEKPPGIRVRHVVIMLSVLKDFLDQYYFTDYHILKDPEKDPSEDNYIPINYEFLCDLIPAYITKLQKHITYEDDPALGRILLEPVPNPDWKDPDILGRWIRNFTKDVGQDFYRTSFADRLQYLTREKKDEELTSCLKEFCKYIMIYSYMNGARRVYIRPQCSSQETDPKAHRIMAEITLAEIERQRIEWENEDYPEDAWDPKRKVFMEQCELEF